MTIVCPESCTITLQLPAILEWWVNMPLADGVAIATSVSIIWCIGWFGRQLMRSV